MKTFVTVLALLCLSAAVPAFAAESAPVPAPVVDVAAPPSPACSPVATHAVPSPQNSEVQSWLMAKPLLLSPESEIPTWLSTGCAAYCAECGGCCAILGPRSCACC
jgi:hypothetical protein